MAASALLVTSIGIPCIYHGTEQQFDGHGDNDRFIREAMFGGEFGPFETRRRHFFDESHPVYDYTELTKILAIRRNNMVIRRGRQFLREISGDGVHFDLPHMIGGVIHSVAPWSRIFNDDEVLLAINADLDSARSAWVTIDAGLHSTGSRLTCVYSTAAAGIGEQLTVEARNGHEGQASAMRTNRALAAPNVVSSLHATRTSRSQPAFLQGY